MHVPTPRRAKLPSLAIGALIVAAATGCSDAVTGPDRPSLHIYPPGPTQSKICKYGPLGTYTFTITSNGSTSGQFLVSNPFTVSVVDEHGTCVFIHQSGTATDNFVITETVPAGMYVERIIRGTFGDGCLTDLSLCEHEYTGTNKVSFSPTPATGYYAYFHNAVDDTPPPPPPPPPPPAGGEGCTPGYWRNHLGAWQGYSPNADFDATFGVNAFSPNITLNQAIRLGGGQVKQLARHATAALLNAAHDDVSYGLTTAQVIAMVQAAVASRNYEPTALLFDDLNNKGCPLN